MKITHHQREFFSGNKKKQMGHSEFKAFFRLRIHDRPIKLGSKVREIWRTNKQVRKMIHFNKWVFGNF